jgi:hypothetical protein
MACRSMHVWQHLQPFPPPREGMELGFLARRLICLCMLAPAAAAAGLDVLTFDLLSIVGKIRAGLGAIGIKKPLPGAPAAPGLAGRRESLGTGQLRGAADSPARRPYSPPLAYAKTTVSCWLVAACRL